MIGGSLLSHSMVNIGVAAVEAASHICTDIFFMGVAGVDVKAGLSTSDLEEAHVKRALSQRAADTIVLTPSEKVEVDPLTSLWR